MSAAFPPPRAALSATMPDWLPDLAITYLAHTSAGVPIRVIARAKGCAASTVLRQVRKVEAWRDDPLIDEALERLGRTHASHCAEVSVNQEFPPMTQQAALDRSSLDEQPRQRIEREARRILRRLCEKGAFLAVAPTMDKAVVLREVAPGKQNRIAIVDRDVAHAFALQEWIACEKASKIACYAITVVGRAALKRLLTEERMARGPQPGLAEAASPFQEQHRFFAEREVTSPDGGARRLRFNLAESPLSVLGRKRDKDGLAYLTSELIEAGERLREDFELAQMGPRVTQNWERFLTAGSRGGVQAGRGMAEGPQDARTRVAGAMEALGPGLSDIVFRICCFLEGLETAEKRLGWSARSGKVVLKIALERLAAHYGGDQSGPRTVQ
ncbi:MAG: helix-turn-helix domain-containing protein [Rhodobacteraceae bacterium]|nr:helix-turn-helix domain-containing protein [Paracoccaceae bacterium]